MFHQHYGIFKWQLLLLSALIISIPSLRSASAQNITALNMGMSNPIMSPDPPARTNRAPRRGSESLPKGKVNSEKEAPPRIDELRDDKQQKIDDAIDDGNKARERNQYEVAVASYEKVSKLDPADSRAHYGLGNIYSDLTCTDSAIGEYREAVRLKKDFHDALIALGYAYVNKERYEEAEQQFLEVFKTTPTDISAKIGLAFLSAKRKKYEDAVTQLKLITDNKSIGNQDRALAHLILGDIYSLQQEWGQEADEYRKTISLNPDISRAYLSLGIAELLPAMTRFGGIDVRELKTEDRENVIKVARTATEHIRQAIYEHKFNHPLGYWYLAIGLIWQFNFREAESNLDTYLAKVKELESELSSIAKTKTCDYGFATLYAHGYRQFGFLYNEELLLETNPQKKDELLKKSIENFKQVIRLKEDDAGAHEVLGMSYLNQGKVLEAIEHLEKAISYETNESNKASTYSSLGLAYSFAGRTPEAIDSLNRAIKIQPQNSSHYLSLGLVFERQANFDEAITQVRKAIALEGRPTAHSSYYLAVLYFQKARQKNTDGDYEEAIKLANGIIEINQTYATAYLLLGQIYKFYKNGTMISEAVKNYELAAKYDERNPVTYGSLGDLYVGVNDDAAIYNLKKAIELKPDNPQYYWELALAYRNKHDEAEAIKQLLGAIKLDENYLNAYLDLASIYRTQNNYSEAMKYLNKAAGFAPADFRLTKELAKMSESQGKRDEAIHYYEEAIKLLKPDDNSFGRELYLCRIQRLRGNFSDAIRCFQKLKLPSVEDPGTIIYDVGVTYIASKNKKAAIEQYQQLMKIKSALADDLFRQINALK